MYLFMLGLILLVMKYLAISPVAAWDWWVVLSPFGLASVWWAWADKTGYTKRKAMEVEDARVKARLDKHREAIGTLSTKKKR